MKLSANHSAVRARQGPPCALEWPHNPSPSGDPTPNLPFELIESILAYIPLRFPLSTIHSGAVTLCRIHKTYRSCCLLHYHCTPALNVIHLTRSMLRVFIPRLPNGHELIIAHPDWFGADFLHRLYLHKFTFPIATTFAVAMQHNRVDILEWWTQSARLSTANMFKSYDRELCPVQLAVEFKAWDVLEWLPPADFGYLCNGSLSDENLIELIKSEGKRQMHFVALWFKAGYVIKGSETKMLKIVCDYGSVPLLDAWVSARPGEVEWMCKFERADDMCGLAIGGKGPVIPMLEWMLQHEFEMPNVAEYASREGDVQVLEWWKEHKSPIDAAWRPWRDPEDDEMDAKNEDIDPEWSSNLKIGFCLDLAREKGYQRVLDWWMQNLDLLLMPNSEEMVVTASGDGDLEFLKIWKHRRKTPDHAYDCNDALAAATQKGQVQVLVWWLRESEILLEFDVLLMVQKALSGGHWKSMVQWWLEYELDKECLSKCGIIINTCLDIKILLRWNALGRILPFDITSAITHAALAGNIQALEWWEQSGISLDAVIGHPKLVDTISARGQLKALEWIRLLCVNRCVEFVYSEHALDSLVWDIDFTIGKSWQLSVVKWWCESGIELRYSEAAFENAIFSLSTEEVEWWLKQRLPLPIPGNLTKETFERRNSSVWSTGGPLLVYSHWFRKRVGFSAE